MDITQIRHNWHEPAGFALNRPAGAGEYILLHFHNAVELYFHQEWHNAPSGTLVVFRPNTAHHFISRSPLLHDWIHLTGDVENEIATFGIRVDTMYVMPHPTQITECIARIESEIFAKNDYWQRYVQSVLEEMWIIIAREISGRTTQPVLQETASRLRELRAEMILHPERHWTNEMMAQQLNISVSRLYPLYRRQFSISPGQDLILMRIEKAKNMLMQGMSVAETAEQLGYANVYHFIRQFKQITGITPGKATRKTTIEPFKHEE